MTLALAAAALLAVGCVLFVARPFLREPAPEADTLDEPDAAEQRRLALAEERDRALAALKEVEFDHRTGKITDDDYRAAVGPLRRAAAEALRAVDGVPFRQRPEEDTMEPPQHPIVPEPAPPPDEGTPPEPVPVPEPYPPDEILPPQ